ncbi:MAG: glycosyl transferase, partial [Terriglobales bacterium]
GMLAGMPWLGAGLFAWAIINRVVQTLVIGYGVVGDPRARTDLWLYPLRDLLGFFLWAASYTGNVIEWRGEKYRMEAGGKMRRV